MLGARSTEKMLSTGALTSIFSDPSSGIGDRGVAAIAVVGHRMHPWQQRRQRSDRSGFANATVTRTPPIAGSIAAQMIASFISSWATMAEK